MFVTAGSLARNGDQHEHGMGHAQRAAIKGAITWAQHGGRAHWIAIGEPIRVLDSKAVCAVVGDLAERVIEKNAGPALAARHVGHVRVGIV